MNVFMVSAVAIASLIASCASTETGSSSMIQSKGVGVNRLVAIGKISVQPGLEDDFKRALPALIKKTQAEYGNLRYYFLQSVAHPESFVSIEAWRDQAAMDSHLKSPAVGDFSNSVGPILVGAPELQTYTVEQNPENDARFAEVASDSTSLFAIIDVHTNDSGALFLNLVKEEIRLTRMEPGYNTDEVYRSAQDANLITVLNSWNGEAGLKAHLAQPYAQKFQIDIGPSLVSPPAVETYKIIKLR